LQIRLGVNGNNTAARKLYLRLGFQVQAKEKVQEQLVWSAAPCR
jgi:ribosomal protein S18 acetylase RimI-like enzyme